MDNICRTCLNIHENNDNNLLTDVSVKIEVHEDVVTLYEMIKLVTSVEVRMSLLHTPNICNCNF